MPGNDLEWPWPLLFAETPLEGEAHQEEEEEEEEEEEDRLVHPDKGL